MKKLRIKINRQIIDIKKASSLLEDLSDIAELDEITGDIVYDESDEIKISEIFDKYFK